MPHTGTLRRLIVFAKAPRPGEVKTRLIPVLGATGAASLHARLVEHTLMKASIAAPGQIELHGAPADDDFLRHCAARYGAPLVEQHGADLGERMYAAFEQAFEHSRCRSVVLVGSDSPPLTPRHLRLALSALHEGHDAVFAPAEDGGYVLVGLRRLDPRLFAGIAWGTGEVMAQTRDRLRTLRWQTLELETLWDVDDAADYQRLTASRLLEDSFDAPA